MLCRLTYEVTFPVDRSVKAVEIRGNREFSVGYDIYRGRVQLLSVTNTVLYGYDILFPQPNADFLFALPAPMLARKVRLTILSSQASGPGFSELSAWGP